MEQQLTFDLKDLEVKNMVSIPFDIYNELIEIKGRYQELKESNTAFSIDEYKELLTYKGKYEELLSLVDREIYEPSDDVNNIPIMRPLNMGNNHNEDQHEESQIPEA